MNKPGLHRLALSALLALGLAATGCGSAVTPGSDGGTDVQTDTPPQTDVPQTDTRNNRVPQRHRPAAVSCETTRPPGPAGDGGTDAGTGSQCTSDSDCTAGDNGRCVQMPRSPSFYCSYDACFNDSDCEGTAVCGCRGSTGGFSAGHVCLSRGNCRVDSDCGAEGYCSPTLDFQCGAFGGTVGYYCHTPQDECVDDADCADFRPDSGFPGWGPPFCAYRPETGRWACSTTQCAG